MAIKVKPLTTASQNFVTNAGNAAAAYAANGAAAAGDYGRNTIAAIPIWRASLNAPGVEQRMANKVQQTGQAKFARKMGTIAQSRYTAGVADARQDWEAGFSPYSQLIQGLSLPPRAVRGSPANKARSAAVGDALAARRLAAVGAGR